MTDTYVNFAALAAAETLGEDYRIRAYERDLGWAAIAIHAGGIETGTSELCRAVAGEAQGDGQWWSEYRFEGLKSSGNSVLHVTSTHFDEPNALHLVGRHAGVLSLHGTSGISPITYLGGLDLHVRTRLGDALTGAGFVVDTASGDIAGADPANIANRGMLGVGVQLEITTAQRVAWFGTNTASMRWSTRNALFQAYVDAIRSVLVGVVEAG